MAHEFTRDQLAFALGESRAQADWLLTTAWHLATRLAATLGALAGGIITRGKAELIVRLTRYLSDDEAKAVEAKILGRAGRLTPGGLRSAAAQQSGWTVDQLPGGTFRWTTPSGRSYDTEPTRYPI